MIDDCFVLPKASEDCRLLSTPLRARYNPINGPPIRDVLTDRAGLTLTDLVKRRVGATLKPGLGIRCCLTMAKEKQHVATLPHSVLNCPLGSNSCHSLAIETCTGPIRSTLRLNLAIASCAR